MFLIVEDCVPDFEDDEVITFSKVQSACKFCSVITQRCGSIVVGHDSVVT